jgi:hypothetical protein
VRIGGEIRVISSASFLSEASGCGNVARQFFTLSRRSISGTFGIVQERNCSISPVALLTVFALLAVDYERNER